MTLESFAVCVFVSLAFFACELLLVIANRLESIARALERRT